MSRFQQLGKALFLSALVLGLNALALLAVTHARHPSHARGSVAHGHHHSFRRWTLDGADSDDEHSFQADTRDARVTKPHRVMLPLLHLTAITSRVLGIPAQEFADVPLRAGSLIALGSTPRAPGAPRAPPAI